MTFRLTDLEAPLDDVEFPNGAKHIPVPFGPTEYKLWREWPHETDAEKRGHMLIGIVTACYPTATVDDFESCTPRMLVALAAHAGRKIDQIRDALKNVGVAEASASPPPKEPEATITPSSPRTNGATSSRKSRARSGKTWWDVYHCKPHGQPHLTWFSYYHLEGAQRIDDLRREINDLDRAMMTAYAFNDTKGLEDRRKELRARLRNDPAKPVKPQWTREEMQAAAQRLVTAVITTGKLPPKGGIQ